MEPRAGWGEGSDAPNRPDRTRKNRAGSMARRSRHVPAEISTFCTRGLLADTARTQPISSGYADPARPELPALPGTGRGAKCRRRPQSER